MDEVRLIDGNALEQEMREFAAQIFVGCHRTTTDSEEAVHACADMVSYPAMGGRYRGMRMNFTSSPFERMMKEVPHPGWDNDDPCKGCRYYKECKGKKKQCRKKFRALIVEPRPSGHRGPKS